MPHQPQYISPQHQTNPLPALAAGKTGQPEVIPLSGRAPVGKIVFAGNLTAAQTVTINGVVFTAVASGATGNQFNIGVGLTNTLDNLVTVLNGSTDPLISPATYSKSDANAGLTATFDTRIWTPSFPLATTAAGATITAVANGAPTLSASLDTEHTQFTITTGLTGEMNLPDGDESQRKTFANLGAGTMLITSATSKLPGTTVQYSMAANSALVLIWLAGKWRELFKEGVTAS